MYDLNDKIEDFSLVDENANIIKLSNYKGKWIVLYFYPKDNTPGCTNEACDFTSSIDEFNDINAVVVGISADSSETHLKFIKNHGLKVKLLSDSTKEIMKKFGAWGEKVLYGKKSIGVIRSTFIISPDFVILEKWHNVKVRTKNKTSEIKHSDVVKRSLKNLQKNLTT